MVNQEVRRGHRLQFAPTDEQRRMVKGLSGCGVPHNDIAKVIKCDPKTLRLHFREELDLGSIEATAKVGQSLFNQATVGGSVAAAIFWMKARAGWREKQEIELTGRVRMDLSHLTSEEREEAARAAAALRRLTHQESDNDDNDEL